MQDSEEEAEDVVVGSGMDLVAAVAVVVAVAAVAWMAETKRSRMREKLAENALLEIRILVDH